MRNTNGFVKPPFATRNEDSFQSAGVNRLALFSFNERWFGRSAKMALEYLNRAMEIIESSDFQKKLREKWTFERVKRPQDYERLKKDCKDLRRDCEYLARFHESRERLKGAESKGVTEWVTKQVFRIVSRGNIAYFHNFVAYRIRKFHSEISGILSSLFENGEEVAMQGIAQK